jgi:hypothetical protein
MNMEDIDEQVEPLHLDFEDREVYLAKVPVRERRDVRPLRAHAICC